MRLYLHAHDTDTLAVASELTQPRPSHLVAVLNLVKKSPIAYYLLWLEIQAT